MSIRCGNCREELSTDEAMRLIDKQVLDQFVPPPLSLFVSSVLAEAAKAARLQCPKCKEASAWEKTIG